MPGTTVSGAQSTISDLQARIARVPRLSLGEFPTPLTECRRLATQLGGPAIFIKREDLSGLGLGGNKSRLLEFRLAEACALGSDVIVAGLDVQSNSARQLTAAANRLGLRTHLVLKPDGPPQWQGNLLIDRILGAEITFLPLPDDDMDVALSQTAERERARGCTPYVMNHARFFGIGAGLAGLEWTIETIGQLAARGLSPSHFYVSSGGKCQSGMVVAQAALPHAFDVIGLNANPHAANGVAATLRIAKEVQKVLDTEYAIDPATIHNRLDQAGARFGTPTDECIEAITLVAQTEGILLDPVFSGKAMAGLIADIRRGALGPDDTVVFVHTGGIPAIFSHATAFLTAMD